MKRVHSLHIPIAVINWNGLQDTIECVESVLKTEKIKFTIYIWDNASANNEFEKLSELYTTNQSIKLYKSDENLGFTKASNALFKIILKETQSCYISLLNNDTVVDTHWLYNIVSFAYKNEAGIVASKMVYYYNRSIMDNAGHRMISTGEIIPIGCGKSSSNVYANSNLGACAGATIYKTSMIKDIGIFDEYFNTGYEDAEYGLRAVLKKYNCVYCDSAIVYHKMGSSIKKVFNEAYSLRIQTSILYTYFKLMPLTYLVFNIPFMFFKYFMMLLIDIIFWRPKYLRILFKSWMNIWQDKSKIREARRNFYSNKETLNSLQIMKRVEFFLLFDIKRFWRFIILKNNSALDSY